MRRTLKQRWMGLVGAVLLGGFLLGCNDVPTKTTPSATLETKKQASTNEFAQSDQLVDRLGVLSNAANAALPQFEGLLAATEDVKSAVINAKEAAQTIRDLYKKLKDIKTVLDLLQLVPVIKDVTSPIRAIAGSMRSTLEPIDNTAKDALDILKPTETNLQKVIDALQITISTLKNIHSAAQGHQGQVSYMKNCAEEQSGAVRTASVAALEGHAQLLLSPVNAMITTLNAITLDTQGLLGTLPQLKTALTLNGSLSMSDIKNKLGDIDDIFEPFEGILNGINSLLDANITVEVLGISYSFKIRDILDGLDIIQDAIDALLSEAMSLLQPLLDKLGVPIPSLPGLTTFDSLLGNFTLDLSNPLAQVHTDLLSINAQLSGFIGNFDQWLKSLSLDLSFPSACRAELPMLATFQFGTGKCLKSGSSVKGVSCNTNVVKQQWFYNPMNNELRVSGLNDKCLEWDLYSAVVKTCDGSSKQQWLFDINRNAMRALSDTSYCLYHGSDNLVKVWQCNWSEDKYKVYVKPLIYNSKLDHPVKIKYKGQEQGKCLKRASTQSGYTLASCSNSNNRKWHFSVVNGKISVPGTSSCLVEGTLQLITSVPALVLGSCSSSQAVTFYHKSNNQQLRAYNTGECLEWTGATNYMKMSACSSSVSQDWSLPAANY